MTNSTLWDGVADRLRLRANEADAKRLNDGQRAALEAIAKRLPRNGVLIADEVGMGKTRIAVEVIRAVREKGGRVAVLIPPGLGFQWQKELHDGGVDTLPVLRSLWKFLEAWKAPDDALLPWDEYPVLLLSHRFTNWAPRKNGESWRWALLPAVAAKLIRQEAGRTPNYGSDQKLDDRWVQECAQHIAKTLEAPRESVLRQLRAEFVAENLRHRASLLDGTSYQKDGRWRPWLERVVGAGLGVFDLVVIDEAHKSRGDDSGLTRLLDNTILQREAARRVALTATPVELVEEQWLGTLKRVGVSAAALHEIGAVVKEYVASARRLRERWRSDSEGRTRYAKAAQAFQDALSPYLLRRDKREDDAVQRYLHHVRATTVDAYRRESEIAIELEALSPEWRRAVMATEALSVACSGFEEERLKRLRLTVANGHGVASMLDHDEMLAAGEGIDESVNGGLRKRLARVEWWCQLLRGSLQGGERSLLQHPAVLAACEAIEAEHAAGRKVLVFGRYTAPMRALTCLLNAREMLRCLRDKRPWPQAKVRGNRGERLEDSDWLAVEAAATQLGMDPVLLDALDDDLKGQYTELRKQRAAFQSALPERLDRALEGRRSASIWRRFKSLIEAEPGDSSDDSLLVLLARSLFELGDGFVSGADEVQLKDLAAAFEEVIDALSDQDSDADTDIDEVAESIVTRVSAALREEFSSAQSPFARLMYGRTSLPSRRMMQVAFNRAGSALRVLVAQSTVGREGLNLHHACRVVVNLHPEWNPAVAEQQIGRVDRVNSLWARECATAIEEGRPGDELPRIEIRPVIFRGTYDEHHWSVLRERWDDLRAQLQGVVVPTRHAGDCEIEQGILRELAACAPRFSPTPGFSAQVGRENDMEADSSALALAE